MIRVVSPASSEASVEILEEAVKAPDLAPPDDTDPIMALTMVGADTTVDTPVDTERQKRWVWHGEAEATWLRQGQ